MSWPVNCRSSRADYEEYYEKNLQGVLARPKFAQGILSARQ